MAHTAIADAKSSFAACIRGYRLNSSEGAALGMICGGTNRILFLPV